MMYAEHNMVGSQSMSWGEKKEGLAEKVDRRRNYPIQ